MLPNVKANTEIKPPKNFKKYLPTPVAKPFKFSIDFLFIVSIESFELYVTTASLFIYNHPA